MVYLLIELFTIVIGAQMTFGWHWRRVSLAVLHSKLLQAIFEVFLVRYEDVVALLTDLRTKEELQLTHHGHLILLLHHVPKLITISLVSAAEDNVIHIDLAHKQFTIVCLREESGIQGTRFESFALQQVFECVIPSTRGLFEAIQCLVSLYTMLGCFGSSKPGGCATYTSSILPLRKALFTSIWYRRML